MLLTDKIKQELVDNFSINKIRSDFLSYLKENFSDCLSDNHFNLTITREVNFSEEKNVAYSNEDQLTILNFFVEIDLHKGAWYKVVIGVGKIKLSEITVPKTEKFFFELKYNNDFTLYDCTMYY